MCNICSKLGKESAEENYELPDRFLYKVDGVNRSSSGDYKLDTYSMKLPYQRNAKADYN